MTTENINPELLEIFLEEAQDLLNAMALDVQQWSADLANTSFLANVKRALHTLKGGARMVNQVDLAQQTHALETVVESLMNGTRVRNQDTCAYLLKEQDKLHQRIQALTPSEAVQKEATGINEDPEGKNKEILRVKSHLLEKITYLATENSILRMNMKSYFNQFNTQWNEFARTLKTLQEKMRERSQEGSIPIVSEVQILSLLCKKLSQIQFDLESIAVKQSRIDLELQDRLLDIRMIPFKSITPRLSRIARQLSEELDKKLDFFVIDSEGEIDRDVLEHVIPCIEHLLRNALDHGIEAVEKRIAANKPEKGQISIRFFKIGKNACLQIIDDGAGISVAAVRDKAVQKGLLATDAVISEEQLIRYILEPGFSTREVMNEISGRGIGLDVVNTVVKGLGGALSIDSKPGQGTTFTIRLPFISSINRILLIAIQDQTIGVLLSSVERIVLLSVVEVQALFNQPDPALEHEANRYMFRYLGQSLGMSSKEFLSKNKSFPVLLFDLGGKKIAFLVDHLLGSQEVVIQNLGPQFKLVDVFSGATVLEDGSVVIIVDPYSIKTELSLTECNVLNKALTIEKKQNILVVDDSLTIRTITKNFLEQHHYQVYTAKDGIDALAQLSVLKPDIILLDMEMPKMNGFVFAEKMKQDARFSNIPIIMITFCSGETHRSKAKQLGIQKFIAKPYQEVELLEAIQAILGKP